VVTYLLLYWVLPSVVGFGAGYLFVVAITAEARLADSLRDVLPGKKTQERVMRRKGRQTQHRRSEAVRMTPQAR
jgi:hypothetical protein